MSFALEDLFEAGPVETKKKRKKKRSPVSVEELEQEREFLDETLKEKEKEKKKKKTHMREYTHDVLWFWQQHVTISSSSVHQLQCARARSH